MINSIYLEISIDYNRKICDFNVSREGSEYGSIDEAIKSSYNNGFDPSKNNLVVITRKSEVIRLGKYVPYIKVVSCNVCLYNEILKSCMTLNKDVIGCSRFPCNNTFNKRIYRPENLGISLFLSSIYKNIKITDNILTINITEY